MIVDADYSISHQNNLAMTIEAVGDTAIRAYRLSRHWANDQQLSMYAEFSKPFTCTIITDTVTDETGRVSARCKALLKFAPTKEGEEIYAKVGISAVDTEGAEKIYVPKYPASTSTR